MLSPPSDYWAELQDGLPPGTPALISGLSRDGRRVYLPCTVIAWAMQRRAQRLPTSQNPGAFHVTYGQRVRVCAYIAYALGLPDGVDTVFTELTSLRPRTPGDEDYLLIVGENFDV